MADRKYIFKQEDGWGKDLGLAMHMGIVASHVVSGHGPFSLTQDGQPLGGEGHRIAILARYRKAISHREVGAVFRIRKGNGDVVVAGRATVDSFHMIDTNGNDLADLYWSWIVDQYSDWHPRFGGAYVCKHVAGSWVLSQHSYGNACDVFFDTIAHQEHVFDDIRNGGCARHSAPPVRVCHAISLRRIWEPDSGTHAYTGETHYHLHADFCPQCSGACGVKR